MTDQEIEDLWAIHPHPVDFAHALLAETSDKQDSYAEGVKDASEAVNALQKYRTVYQVTEDGDSWHNTDWLTYESTAEADRQTLYTTIPETSDKQEAVLADKREACSSCGLTMGESTLLHAIKSRTLANPSDKGDTEHGLSDGERVQIVQNLEPGLARHVLDRFGYAAAPNPSDKQEVVAVNPPNGDAAYWRRLYEQECAVRKQRIAENIGAIHDEMVRSGFMARFGNENTPIDKDSK